MKKIQNLIIFLFSIGISAQSLNEINSSFNLPDSISHKNEIRIYKGGGKSKFSSLFRMFKDKSGKWKVEVYEHYEKVSEEGETQAEKQVLKPKNRMEFLWQSILRTNIQSLPNMSEISYKMRERGNIKLIDGKYKLTGKVMLISDGIGYKIQIKTGNKINIVYYSNPESYLKYYPEVDELIYFNELLNLIKNKYDIWKK